MSDAKPLHVQVAIALGWLAVDKKWWTGAYVEGQDGASVQQIIWAGVPPKWAGRGKLGIEPIRAYDTDWSATGPLIEKYKIDVQWLSASGGLKEPTWKAARYESAPDDDEAGYGDTPLIAVCDLILALKAAGKL